TRQRPHACWNDGLSRRWLPPAPQSAKRRSESLAYRSRSLSGAVSARALHDPARTESDRGYELALRRRRCGESEGAEAVYVRARSRLFIDQSFATTQSPCRHTPAHRI